MRIILSVISIKGQAPFSAMSYTFDQEGGTAGRDQRADWVLLDENKYLSGTHFKIHCDGKSFSVMDISTNGTYINDSILPLGLDNSHVLNNGDQIKIGEYVVLVSAIESSDNSETFQQIDDFTAPNNNPSSNLEDPFFSAQGHFSDSGVSKAQKKKINISQKSTFVNVGSVDSPKENLKDPFFSNGDEYINPEGEIYTLELDDEPVVKGSFSVDMNTPLRTNSLNPNTPQNNGVQQDSSHIDESKLEDKNDVFDFLDESNQKEISIEEVKSDNTKRAPSLVIKQLTPIETSTKKSNTKDSDTNSNSNSNKGAIEAFLKGAGLNQDSFASDMPIELFETIGEIFSGVLQGTIDLLRSRSEIKNHLHLDRTIINSIENNPLKFMPNSQQVILHILTKETSDNTYLPLVSALEEAFDDIKAHQVAMTAATEKALKAVIKEHFSPKSLADNISKTNPISAVIPIQRQAKLWSMFEILYENIEESATESFQRLLEHEISNAYEEQLLEIKSLRERGNEFP